jgi:hypothetical protein
MRDNLVVNGFTLKSAIGWNLQFLFCRIDVFSAD